MNRYTRHIQLTGFGPEKQEMLIHSKVLVVGAGGLGCPVLQNLVAMGVRKIGIVDRDKIELHNLHRQLLYTESDVGSYKTEVARQRLQAMNNSVEIEEFKEFLDNFNAFDIFSKYDLIIDGTDQMHTRFLINDVCLVLDKPWIYGAVGAFEGQVSVFNVKNKAGVATQFRDLFPDPEKMGNVDNCNQRGVLGVLPNLIGHLMVIEAVKLLTKLGEGLVGKILHYNILNNQQHIFTIKPNGRFTIPDKKTILQTNYEQLCPAVDQAEKYLHWKKLINNTNCLIVDVRLPHELPVCSGDNVIRIPLHELESRWRELHNFENIIFICQSGIRSKQALNILENSSFKGNFSHVEGGIEEYLKYRNHE